MKRVNLTTFDMFFIQIGTASCGAIVSFYAILSVIQKSLRSEIFMEF